MKSFLAIYSTFMQRAFDMIVHDIALQNLNVCLCMDRAGLSGEDGPTHHGLFDIDCIRHIPGIVHMQPKDEIEFQDMLWTMTHYQGGPLLSVILVVSALEHAWKDPLDFWKLANRRFSIMERKLLCLDSAICVNWPWRLPNYSKKKESV
jgi:hypothetical protein